jgi:hypothetical protein
MMNYKLQLSPISSTHESQAASGEDAKFFRSWLIYDSDLEVTRTRGRLNWSTIAGAALAAVVSLSGWFGIVMLLRHFWK